LHSSRAAPCSGSPRAARSERSPATPTSPSSPRPRSCSRSNFYTRAIASKQLKGDELSYLVGAKENEIAHYDALKGVLKSQTPSGLKFVYPSGSFASRASIGNLGEALETAFVGAYMGAVGALQSNALKSVAAEIGACESRHLSVLTNIAANGIVPAPALPQVLTAAQATAAVKPFLA